MQKKDMTHFSEEIQGIYRLKVPFEELYTSVFLIDAEQVKILVDCATTAEDVDTYIIPALHALNYSLPDVDILVLTHRHEDHAGGTERMLEIAPNIEVVTDTRQLCKSIITYPLPGHTEDSIGVLDERTHTLISGDGLQGAGVGKYRCTIKNFAMYQETLKRIDADERIENILFSHAYEPWFQAYAFGRPTVRKCLSDCEKYGKESKI